MNTRVTERKNCLPLAVSIRRSPAPPSFSSHFAELWTWREALLFLALHEATIDSRRAVLGRVWNLLVPLLPALVYGVSLAGGGTRAALNGALPAYIGLLLWFSMVQMLGAGGHALPSRAHLMQSLALPRLIFPLAAFSRGLASLAAGHAVVVLAVLWQGNFSALFCAATLCAFFAAAGCGVGVGLAFAALAVRLRDLLALQQGIFLFWLLATPIVYSVDTIPQSLRIALFFNPLTAPVLLLQAAATGLAGPGCLWGLCLSQTFLLPLLGLWVFHLAGVATMDNI